MLLLSFKDCLATSLLCCDYHCCSELLLPGLYSNLVTPSLISFYLLLILHSAIEYTFKKWRLWPCLFSVSAFSHSYWLWQCPPSEYHKLGRCFHPNSLLPAFRCYWWECLILEWHGGEVAFLLLDHCFLCHRLLSSAGVCMHRWPSRSWFLMLLAFSISVFLCLQSLHLLCKFLHLAAS